ncbi:hypothetical protein Tco_1386704 [Tanacetum coccineum]
MDDDDDEEYSIPLNKMPQILRSIALAPVSSIIKPEDSLSIGDEHLSTIPEKGIETNHKDSVEDLVPRPSDPRIHSEVARGNIESMDSYVSNLDESSLLVTPLFDANEDECLWTQEDTGSPDGSLPLSRGPHESFQCQPWHQHYSDLNPCYDSNSYNFDQPDHQPQIIHEDQSWINDKLKKSNNEILKWYDLCLRSFVNDCRLLILVLILLKPSRHYNYKDDDDDDEEFSIPLNKMPQILRSIALAPISSIMEPEDSLSMGDEHLSTIPEKESNEFIKTSVKDLVLIPSESEDTSESDNNRDLPLCDNFSPINDVPEDNVKIYSNSLFEFDDEYISSDVNPGFNEVLENIESKESYVSNLDDPNLLVTPLSDANKDECFDPGGDIDEIDAFLDMDISTDIKDDYYDSEGDIIYLESLIIKDTIPNLFPEVFFDHEPKCLKDEPKLDNLTSMVKVFDPDIHKKKFSPTYVSLPIEDRHYLSFTYVIRIFLPYFTYPMDSFLPLSSGSEDIIFDPGISTFHFSSLELDCPDFEDPRARGFVHHSLDLQSLA